jgi:hypothetical protein
MGILSSTTLGLFEMNLGHKSTKAACSENYATAKQTERNTSLRSHMTLQNLSPMISTYSIK